MPNGLPNGLPNNVPNGLPNDLSQMTRYWQRFDLSSVIGTTTPPPNNMVFCDTAEGGPGSAAFVGHWVGITQTQGPIMMD
jgi:hypothetical protein